MLGPAIRTPISQLLNLPVVPSIFGFDPRFQLIHEVDVVRSILFVLENDLAGIYNVAGDGMLPWSEVATICGVTVATATAGGMPLKMSSGVSRNPPPTPNIPASNAAIGAKPACAKATRRVPDMPMRRVPVNISQLLY